MNKHFKKEPLIKLSKKIANSYYQKKLDEKDKEINELKQEILHLKSIIYSSPTNKHSLHNTFKLNTLEFSTSNNTEFQDSEYNKISPKSLSCSKNSDIKHKFSSLSSTFHNFDSKKLKLTLTSSKIKKIKLKNNLLSGEILNEKGNKNIDNNCDIFTFQQIKDQFSILKLRMYKILTKYNKY